MKNNVKSLTAIMAVTLLLGAGLVAISNIDDAMASPNLKQIDPTYDNVYFVSTGKTITIDFSEFSFFDVNSKPSWLTTTSNGLTGKAPSIGVYTVDIDGSYDEYGEEIERVKIQLHAVAEGNVTLTTIVYTDNNKVVAIDYTKTGTYTADIAMSGDLASTKYSVVVTGITPEDVIPGQTITVKTQNYYSFPFVFFRITEKEVPLLTMPYTAPSGNAIANTNWTYTPTTVSGVTLTVTGASWLSVSNNMIYGVPPAAGTYDITVKMVKSGYEDCTETFTLTVVSALTVLNSPSMGAIMFVS